MERLRGWSEAHRHVWGSNADIPILKSVLWRVLFLFLMIMELSVHIDNYIISTSCMVLPKDVKSEEENIIE